jgi:IS1 family transposase
LVLGDRTWDNVARLWSKVPKAWQRRLVYTDGYGAYAAFLSPWQHQVCQKFDGGTSTVEGVNHLLRHRCGALVRRTGARCRDQSLLEKRIHLSAEAHNLAGERRLKRRTKTTGRKR